MKNRIKYILTLSMILGVVFSNIYNVEAVRDNKAIHRSVRQADLIVEGYVEMVAEGVQQIHDTQIAQPSTSLIFGFGNVLKTSFRVTRVYKGEAEFNSSIQVLSNLRSETRSDRLVKKHAYLLFLTKVPGTGAYEIMNYGESHWMIFNYNGKSKLRAWYQEPRLREEGQYLDYQDFTTQLKTYLSSL